MTTLFSLLQTVSRVAVLDDDVQYLEALSIALPGRFDLTLHSSTKEMDRFLSGAQSHSAQEQVALTRIADGHGRPILAALTYLSDPNRFQVTGVLVSDHAMPAETGVSFCARHNYKGLRRILLTGFADQDIAIDAFNNGAIEMYMSKQSPNLLDKLIDSLDLQMQLSARKRGSILEAHVPARSAEILSSPEMGRALDALLKRANVSEYVFVCDPLGLMCLTDSGQALWIQLEDEETLYGLADFLDESEWDPVEIELVRQKEAAVDVEVASQVSVHHASCQKLTLLRESPYFGAAVFPMTNLPKDMSLVGHSGWLAANGNTRVV